MQQKMAQRKERFFIALRPFMGIAAITILAFSCSHPAGNEEDWAAAGGNAGQTKFSGLTQVNKQNVAGLKEAWVYHSGNTSGNVQCNPLVVDGVMYVTTPDQHLVAVNAVDGKEIWRFNPARNDEAFGAVNRGLAYWRSGGDSRIIYSSGSYLNAVDVVTGKNIIGFGDKGRIHLSEGLERPADQMNIQAPAAPVIYKDLVIVGATTWSADANISGFDVRTGERKWVFHTIPHPGEYGYDTWGDTSFYRKGAGVNAWGGLCVDDENGMVFISTGQPKGDFYRPNNPGKQLYGNSIIALNARSGKRVWHYQTIHKDLWDLDLPCPPILVTLQQEGKNVAGVAQLSKTGNIFLFNRLTGEVISKIEERPVPASTLYGEEAWATQPFVTWPEPFSRQVLTKDELTNLSPQANAKAKTLFDQVETGWFVPPSEKGLLYYGIHGGAEWGGGAYDEKENVLFINANELAWHIVMKNSNAGKAAKAEHPGRSIYLSMNCSSCHGANREGIGSVPALNNVNSKYNNAEVTAIIKNGKKAMPAFSQIEDADLRNLSAYLLNNKVAAKLPSQQAPSFESLGYNKFLDDEGYPATLPPWGTLNAVDLHTGKIKWKVPLGEYEELTKKGIPLTGTENFGSCLVTEGGLVFIAATRDQKIRAFDKETGKLLWEAKLPFGGYSQPSTYAVNGKQYIVIPATGGGKLGGPTGDTYVAFALPEKK